MSKFSLKNILGLLSIFSMVILTPIARIVFKRKKLFIVGERRNEARDNGFVFYRWLKENEPTINAYYVIDKKSIDYKQVSCYGNIIKFGGLKHLFIFCGAKYIISSVADEMCPNHYINHWRLRHKMKQKFIFLQHGVIKDLLPSLFYKKTKFDLFICGAYPEYLDVKEKYGYPEGSVVYTGLSRFDNYKDIKNERSILIMPTWRRGIENLKESNFYKSWEEVINNEIFTKMLQENNIKSYFYIHPLYQKYSDYFQTSSINVLICSARNYNIQDLLKKCSCLVTDFSSTFFDFAYMQKPMIFYQFDEKDFFERHYQKGYFDYRIDGFGRVVTNLNDFIDEICLIVKNNFKLSDFYKERCQTFFPKRDANNSKRIFEEIIKL